MVDGERQRFTSKILPPYLRRSKNVSELLPLGSLDGHSITGVALVVRKDDAGELVSVTDDDIAAVIARFKPSKTMN